MRRIGNEQRLAQSKWEQMGANGSERVATLRTTKSYMRPRKNSMHHILSSSHGPPRRIKEEMATCDQLQHVELDAGGF